MSQAKIPILEKCRQYKTGNTRKGSRNYIQNQQEVEADIIAREILGDK